MSSLATLLWQLPWYANIKLPDLAASLSSSIVVTVVLNSACVLNLLTLGTRVTVCRVAVTYEDATA